MQKPITKTHWSIAAIASLLLTACGAPPVATTDTGDLSFDQAVTSATDGLIAQADKLPSFLADVEAKIAKREVVIDPMLDASSGQQTALTQRLEQGVIARMRATHPQFEILPFEPANLAKASHLITGTTTRVQGDKGSRAIRIDLALTDLKTRNVVAQASARARDEGLDTSPTAYYSDSPILVKDNVVDGYIRTSATRPVNLADGVYLERISTATLISDAARAYNAGQYDQSLAFYQQAAGATGGEQLRVLNGIYLAEWKLGRTADAERAFGKVVAFGITNNNLGVKFLFNPGTTEFWSDPKVSGPYPMWLRQIARQSATAKACINIVGHTSHTGSATLNDRLSEQRAAYIKQRLETEAPELSSRSGASGMGFRENIVGTGTDDARDALDRRVEFKIVSCR